MSVNETTASHNSSGAPTRAGTIAIVGRPNAGKSTLLNALLGQKIAAVSPKAQTTRQRLIGIVMVGQSQLVFTDTPGLFTAAAKNKLESAMLESVWESVAGADVILLLLDASQKNVLDKNADLITRLADQKTPVFVVLNKVDAVSPRDALLPLAARAQQELPQAEIFMTSALKHDGLASLKERLADRLPLGPWLYPEDDLTTAPLRALAAELTREQLYLTLGAELPYDATVVPETWEETASGQVRIGQAIVVARDSQKAIVIGKGGQKLKEIGSAARAEIAALLGAPVHLQLFVKVTADWQNKKDFI